MSTSARAATVTTCPGASPTSRIFNVNNGSYRCPSTQQGYSPFTTWTRGLAWVLLRLRRAARVPRHAARPRIRARGGRAAVLGPFLRVARATADYYMAQTPTDGVPYWDTGAPGLARLGGYLERPADPFNELRAGRQLGGGHRGAGPRAARALPARQGAVRSRRRYLAAGPHHRPDDLRRALSFDVARGTRGSCSTRSTTGPTVGTACRGAARSPAASRACGATTTPASSRC